MRVQMQYCKHTILIKFEATKKASFVFDRIIDTIYTTKNGSLLVSSLGTKEQYF